MLAALPTLIRDLGSFALLLGVLIFVHELGHFVLAKLFDVKVLRFSLGFGPPIVTLRYGETEYVLSAFPLGGYVKMVGESPQEEIDPQDAARSFGAKPTWQRVLIAMAGPGMNLFLPVIILTFIFLAPERPPYIGAVVPDRPAARAGLTTGDRIVSIDGRTVRTWLDLHDAIGGKAGEPIDIAYERHGSTLTARLVPDVTAVSDPLNRRRTVGRIGIIGNVLGPRVGVASTTCAAARAGIVTGDEVVAVAGRRVDTFEQLGERLIEAGTDTLRLTILRPTLRPIGTILEVEVPDLLELSLLSGTPRSLAALGLASSETFVRSLVPDGPAATAGLRPGDRIAAVDGAELRVWSTLEDALEAAPEVGHTLTVERDGRRFAAKLKARKTSFVDEVKQEHTVFDAGFATSEGAIARAPRSHWSVLESGPHEAIQPTLLAAFARAVDKTIEIIGLTLAVLWMLLTGKLPVSTVGGPIMIWHVASSAAEAGLPMLFVQMAQISVGLGIMNLLPVPVLDGGHLLFCAIEAVKRKPVSLRVREVANAVGLALLAVLILLVFTNDINRYFLNR